MFGPPWVHICECRAVPSTASWAGRTVSSSRKRLVVRAMADESVSLRFPELLFWRYLAVLLDSLQVDCTISLPPAFLHAQ